MSLGLTHPTCLGCHRRLPPNDVVEVFPYGRRLAYDPELMRLWIVCGRCRKWSLVPVEPDERADAIDTFERWWRASQTRYSTGGIGVGEYTRRLSIVRVGASSWNEFAAWRYAGAMTRRRHRRWMGGAGLIGGGTAMYLTSFWSLVDIIVPMGSALLTIALFGRLRAIGRRPICRIPSDGGSRAIMRAVHLTQLEMLRDAGRRGGWRLNATHDHGASAIVGQEAVRALSYVMPEINYFGASGGRIQDALVLISEGGGSEGFVETAARPAASASQDANAVLLGSYPAPVRVALEIASQEQQERRALEDELALLWNEWREAEEIATIVDRLNPGASEQPPGQRGLA